MGISGIASAIQVIALDLGSEMTNTLMIFFLAKVLLYLNLARHGIHLFEVAYALMISVFHVG